VFFGANLFLGRLLSKVRFFCRSLPLYKCPRSDPPFLSLPAPRSFSSCFDTTITWTSQALCLFHYYPRRRRPGPAQPRSAGGGHPEAHQRTGHPTARLFVPRPPEVGRVWKFSTDESCHFVCQLNPPHSKDLTVIFPQTIRFPDPRWGQRAGDRQGRHQRPGHPRPLTPGRS